MRTAADTYEELARLCTDAELGSTFAKLAKEERQHVEWWSELLAAWEAGLVPDIADEHGLLLRLKEIQSDLAASLPHDLSLLDEDGMLDLAVRFEFFMLDHAFSELTELMQPGGHAVRHEAYFRHGWSRPSRPTTHSAGSQGFSQASCSGCTGTSNVWRLWPCAIN